MGAIVSLKSLEQTERATGALNEKLHDLLIPPGRGMAILSPREQQTAESTVRFFAANPLCAESIGYASLSSGTISVQKYISILLGRLYNTHSVPRDRVRGLVSCFVDKYMELLLEYGEESRGSRSSSRLSTISAAESSRRQFCMDVISSYLLVL